MQVLDYVLSTEAEDFFEQAAEQGITYDNWENLDHVYGKALKALGLKPDPSDFLD